MDAVVILAGDLPCGYAEKLLRQKAAEGCPLIAADAGADRLAALGLTPHVIVGDGDSLTGSFPRARFIKYPARKDFTDGQAALELALSQADGPVWLLGALGGRPDHMLANLLLPLGFDQCERVRLAGEDWQGVYLKQGRHRLTGQAGETVSLLPLTPVMGLTLSGFEYPLEGQKALPGDSRTLSNVLSQTTGVIEFDSGCLLVIRLLSREDAEREDKA